MAIHIFVPDVPEFTPLVEGARKADGCRIEAPMAGYWCIRAESEVRFERRALGLGPALWNSALAGGFTGRIVEYSRDILRVVSEDRDG